MLRAGSDLGAKDKVLASDPRVAAFLDARGPVARVLSNVGSEEAYLVKCVVAVGQEACWRAARRTTRSTSPTRFARCAPP